MLTQIIITSMAAVFSLPQLPYESNALEPVISKETIDYHYGKHLQAYVNTLNTLVKGTEYEKKNLEEIVRHAPVGPLFNNAGQVLNHTLYFEQFRPVGAEGPAVPEGKLDKAIRTAFGSLTNSRRKWRQPPPVYSVRVGRGWRKTKRANWLSYNVLTAAIL